jgi:hypothetical protein
MYPPCNRFAQGHRIRGQRGQAKRPRATRAITGVIAA